ncbi:hypothetical protein PVL30_000589 [Lodderomyces elongisporus]|uniref:uncharacterized protein n=1 Tax=Lodderomyces elongisporus TaxID=36914 RepID=UPI002921E097|nr:uncharacterized protein PVL30_000589 [Lodderomyces elongisporus]WLF76884.1 hypothetical protein PVL30_000589 [Lodderomyces elongisporus]
MSELYFLRHAQRIDHALQKDQSAKPISEQEYQPYDPPLTSSAVDQIKHVVDDICDTTDTFTDKESSLRKNVFIHFSPYLRCCQTADLLITELKAKFSEKFPNYKVRFQLLGDFALSEWIHENMKHKPPFVDSNDAYNMYTPNMKSLKNKNACSNFRPMITLGQYNGPDLTYKEYQSRCKEYFQKLLATYDKPTYIKNKDIIIVVSHGYLINNFMSCFLNHPVFEEIPDAALNFARRVKKEEFEKQQDDYDPEHYCWRMEKDALGLAEKEGVDAHLNLETEVVYYKTNFIKKNDLIEKPHENQMRDENKPRASFKIESTSASKNANGRPTVTSYLCPAAKNWKPNEKHYKIKAEFKAKMMNDEAFKRDFAITNPPSRQISPDVSPNSAPTRNNSVIDLSKIMSNDSIQPLKLKYSHTSEIPIHKINSRMNSQVNLQQAFAHNSSHNHSPSQVSSTESSHTDLPKYVAHLQNRHRSSSNPNSSVFVAPQTKDSYFPQVINRVRSNESDMSIDSTADHSFDELDIIDESSEGNGNGNGSGSGSGSGDNSSSQPPPPTAATIAAAAAANTSAMRASPIDTLNRARSLNKKPTNNPLLLSYKKRSQQSIPNIFSRTSNNNNSNNNNNNNDNNNNNNSTSTAEGATPDNEKDGNEADDDQSEGEDEDADEDYYYDDDDDDDDDGKKNKIPRERYVTYGSGSSNSGGSDSSNISSSDSINNGTSNNNHNNSSGNSFGGSKRDKSNEERSFSLKFNRDSSSTGQVRTEPGSQFTQPKLTAKSTSIANAEDNARYLANKKRPVFYNFDTDTDSDSDDASSNGKLKPASFSHNTSSKGQKYSFFGQNR